MQVGDLVKEKTGMKRPCSLGIVLETQPCRGADCEYGKEEYFVRFFDDNDKCWMSNKFLESL